MGDENIIIEEVYTSTTSSTNPTTPPTPIIPVIIETSETDTNGEVSQLTPSYNPPNIEVDEIDVIEPVNDKGIVYYTGPMSFSILDWQLDGDWFLFINHKLNCSNPTTTIRDVNDVVMANEVEVIDNNNIKIWVPSTPDCRFAGIISILKS